MLKFLNHLQAELFQLYSLFDKKWPKYRDSWKGMAFHELMQRLIGEHPENKGEFTEFMEAVDSGDWEQIRHEALDSIMVLFFIVQHANKKLEVMAHSPAPRFLIPDHDAEVKRRAEREYQEWVKEGK